MDWICPSLADPSYLNASNLKRFNPSEDFESDERPPSLIVVDDEEEYEVEAILRHKGKGTKRLCLVMWEGYSITESPGSLNRISKILL